MVYDMSDAAQAQRVQEVEDAFNRARGHVAEVRRLVETGAPAYQIYPLLDQIDADHNTVRPEHPGFAVGGQYAGQYPNVVTTPTGLSGNPAGEPGYAGEAVQADERPVETSEVSEPEIGSDGLTDEERATLAEDRETA